MEEWQSKTHRNDCEQSRDRPEKKRRRGKTMSSQWQTATQGIQHANRNISEGSGRDKLKNVDGDFPACMRLKKESIEDNTKKKASEEEEEDDSNTTMSTETCHCVWEKLKGTVKAAAAAMEVKKTIKAKWWGEAKICAALRHERETQKNMRSMHSSERIAEMICELAGYRWDALLLCETWRNDKEEIWETHHKQIFMGAGKYDNKHGVGILRNKNWKQRIIDTKYINERAISTTILVNRHRIKLMSKKFTTRDMRTTTSRICTERSRSTLKIAKRYIPIIGGDFNAELGLGHGNECISVGRYTLNEGNRRGDWMKHWLMLQGYTALNALNTMYRKHLRNKRLSFLQKEKQIDYILTKRRHTKDAEANDMIHMRSDHRCVMATFTITMPGKNIHDKNTWRKHDMIEYEERDQAKKHWSREAWARKKIPGDHWFF